MTNDDGRKPEGGSAEAFDHLRRAPEVLDDDEDEDPYKIKDVTPNDDGK